MAVKVLVPKELGKPLGMYSHGVIAPGGELVVVAGQVGMDAAGKLAGPGAEYIEGFIQARREVFPACYSGGAYPPNTLLVISRLVRPDLLVEIEAMAVRPSRAAAAPKRAAKPRARKARATRKRR
jgi:enamine deaminase RidA (YjgF/YER057c/UK114 family)